MKEKHTQKEKKTCLSIVCLKTLLGLCGNLKTYLFQEMDVQSYRVTFVIPSELKGSNLSLKYHFTFIQ